MRPPLRRTPWSWGKPISTARPGARATSPPCQNSVISPRRGSSGRCTRSGGAETGSSCVYHLATLDDPPDMIYPKVVEEMPIIGHIADHQISLFADLQRTEPIGTPK